jgi:short-subunit dehydrogenase
VATGASSGIGYELALQFAKNGHNLIILARQENKLIQLANALKKNYKIQVFLMRFIPRKLVSKLTGLMVAK